MLHGGTGVAVSAIWDEKMEAGTGVIMVADCLETFNCWVERRAGHPGPRQSRAAWVFREAACRFPQWMMRVVIS